MALTRLFFFAEWIRVAVTLESVTIANCEVLSVSTQGVWELQHLLEVATQGEERSQPVGKAGR